MDDLTLKWAEKKCRERAKDWSDASLEEGPEHLRLRAIAKYKALESMADYFKDAQLN